MSGGLQAADRDPIRAHSVDQTRLIRPIDLVANHKSDSGHDFGKDIFPTLVSTYRAMAYRFGGTSGRVTADRYWRDVGTIDAYYEASMDLLHPMPPIDLYQ